MTVLGFFGNLLTAFGPAIVIFIFRIFRDAQLVILALTSAFFFSIATLLSSLLWYVAPGIRSNDHIIILFSVAIQEIGRLLLFLLYRRTFKGFFITSKRTPSPFIIYRHSFAMGFGIGITSGFFFYVNQLVASLGPAIIPCRSCPRIDVYFISSISTSIFILLHTVWNISAFINWFAADEPTLLLALTPKKTSSRSRSRDRRLDSNSESSTSRNNGIASNNAVEHGGMSSTVRPTAEGPTLRSRSKSTGRRPINMGNNNDSINSNSARLNETSMSSNTHKNDRYQAVMTTQVPLRELIREPRAILATFLVIASHYAASYGTLFIASSISHGCVISIFISLVILILYTLSILRQQATLRTQLYSGILRN